MSYWPLPSVVISQQQSYCVRCTMTADKLEGRQLIQIYVGQHTKLLLLSSQDVLLVSQYPLLATP